MSELAQVSVALIISATDTFFHGGERGGRQGCRDWIAAPRVVLSGVADLRTALTGVGLGAVVPGCVRAAETLTLHHAYRGSGPELLGRIR